MANNFNQLANSNSTEETNNTKFCVAMNFLIKTRTLQSKDSPDVFDQCEDPNLEDATPMLVEKVMGVMEENQIRVAFERGGMSNETFATSLSDQLQAANARNAIIEIEKLHDGMIAFSVGEGEINEINDRFPHNHCTLKIFDTLEERRNFINIMPCPKAETYACNKDVHQHLDA